VAIDIQLTETTAGVTTSLSFAVSPEAFARETSCGTRPDGTSNIPDELRDSLYKSVRQEALGLLDEVRTKLHLRLLSSYGTLLQKDAAANMDPAEEKVSDPVSNSDSGRIAGKGNPSPLVAVTAGIGGPDPEFLKIDFYFHGPDSFSFSQLHDALELFLVDGIRPREIRAVAHEC
jgi:hypothetical protein